MAQLTTKRVAFWNDTTGSGNYKFFDMTGPLDVADWMNVMFALEVGQTTSAILGFRVYAQFSDDGITWSDGVAIQSSFADSDGWRYSTDWVNLGSTLKRYVRFGVQATVTGAALHFGRAQLQLRSLKD